MPRPQKPAYKTSFNLHKKAVRLLEEICERRNISNKTLVIELMIYEEADRLAMKDKSDD